MGRVETLPLQPARVTQRSPIDLARCADELIHLPGSIQPHGVLLAADAETLVILYVSENFRASTGLPAQDVLGTSLNSLLGAEGIAALENAPRVERYGPANFAIVSLAVKLRPRRTVLFHRHRGLLFLELEEAPAQEDQQLVISSVQSIIATLRRAETVEALCIAAVNQLRLLTFYDRVMMYRFDPDGHGTVVAEDRRADLEPLLNLRYPASDIPPQARQLYTLQRVRVIPDAQYTPVGLLANAGVDPDADVDMTYCTLRGVSPIHREYLSNMGVRATLAISLVQDGALTGMIICHSETRRAPPAELRALCDVVGQVIAVLLLKVSEAEELQSRLQRQHAITALRDDIDSSDSVMDGLLKRPGALLELVDATGALVRCNGRVSLIGVVPPEAHVADMAARLRLQHGEAITGIADAGIAGGIAADHAREASGILLMPISNDPGDAVMWFRPEHVQTIAWGGDPHGAVIIADGTQRLSPRKSFSAWKEELRGRSLPWSQTDLRAVHELRRAIMSALLRQAEARLAQLSAYDPLTGLANRRTLEACIAQWRQAQPPAPAALLFLDLDRFKTVNDSLGHGAGDEILTEVASRLRALAPTGSMPGRLGGDEFVLFWPGASHSQAEFLAAAIMRELARPMQLRGRQHYATASLGVACSTIAGSDDLMREADAAMYAAKRQGGARAITYEPTLHSTVLTTMQLEQDLFEALHKNQVEVHYQPVVAADSRKLVGFEALARWQHPVRGWVAPSLFIPLAEGSGLIKQIGAWVMAQAARQARLFRQTMPDLTMSVNVSPRQLTDGSFSAMVAGILTMEGLPAKALCIEVTESALMNEEAVRELHKVRATGARVALDDFGTGYSSLSYLHQLPVDIVKIDRSFVSVLGTTPRADRFFRAIVDLAHTIDLRTTAEGCETEAQMHAVAASGCGTIQGWAVARAMPAEEATLFLERQDPLA
jgi:diguanylate cyclase (GGDEF)-like protein